MNVKKVMYITTVESPDVTPRSNILWLKLYVSPLKGWPPNNGYARHIMIVYLTVRLALMSGVVPGQHFVLIILIRDTIIQWISLANI